MSPAAVGSNIVCRATTAASALSGEALGVTSDTDESFALSVLHRDGERILRTYVTDGYGGPGVSLFRLPGYVGGEPGQTVPRDVVAVMMALPQGPGPASWNVDFWIADAEQAAAAAPGLGGSVIAPPHDAPPFRRAVLAAPDGATFSVSELRLPA